MKKICLFALVLSVLATAACDKGDENFSQYPGFDSYFRRHPRASAPPAATDQLLLKQFQSILFVAGGAEGPIDFYKDYIAQGALYDGDSSIISDQVTSEILNAHKQDPGVRFVHQDLDQGPTPVAYGRIDREPFDGLGQVTFLTYHFAFRRSGLPESLNGMARFALAVLGDLEDWHQLDHYTAVALALDRSARPFALMLQQHNYLRSYILGLDLELPENGAIQIDAAIGSNELYPHAPERTARRAVSFFSQEGARYLVTGRNPPFLAADDVTDPGRRVDYGLEFLPPNDAFYSFQGFLGEQRWLPGRSGPPGADFNTLPAFKDRVVQLVAHYWQEVNEPQLARLRAYHGAADSDGEGDGAFRALRRHFLARLALREG